jgi:antitoxin component HigA of HigAB toxin-antitoxin module
MDIHPTRTASDHKIERLWGARRRPLTIAMIAKQRDKLGISADILIGSHPRAA